MIYYAPARNASFMIHTVTNSSRFWMKYEYINVAFLSPKQLPIAIPTAVNLTSTNQYTFTSSNTNEKLVISAGSSIYDSDPYTSNIYIYDGPDVRSSFLGDLKSFIGNNGYFRVSTGNTLTLANFYGEQTYSYALVNEYSVLEDCRANHVITYFLEDSNEGFLTELSLEGVSPVNGTVTISPKTPTDRTNPLLSYQMSIYDNQKNMNLPQQIPCNLFTISSTSPIFTLRLAADNAARQKWTKAYPGRMGSVISPSLWSQGASPAYNYTFTANTTLHFQFNVQSAVISTFGEKLSVEIGSAGSALVNTTFQSSVSNPGVRMANGTYMMVTYTGNQSNSSYIVTFEMDGFDGNPTTTTQNGSSALYDLYSWLFIVVCTFYVTL